LHQDLPDISEKGPLFLTGRKNLVGRVSRFYSTPIGKNTLAQIGKNTAQFLGLQDPDKYTGHCFRRSTATQAANGGASCKQLQHHMGWRNPNTALEYLANSEPQQLVMAKLITGFEPSG
jgi:integrase